MADRTYHESPCQGIRHVMYRFSVAAAAVAANPPTFVEGDLSGASVGSYVTCTKIATGKYRFTTTNPFVGCVNFVANLCMATPDLNTYIQPVKPVQNANGTWQFDVWVTKNAAGVFSLADLLAGDQLQVTLTLRNSGLRP